MGGGLYPSGVASALAEKPQEPLSVSRRITIPLGRRNALRSQGKACSVEARPTPPNINEGQRNIKKFLYSYYIIFVEYYINPWEIKQN